ncbi:MAG: PQQ-binding-like beta-propeller repeat protein [Bacteroidales bacterium]|nr:PQQ-binding-like beta-propeller repeat protein [Bacteroidales bacterium]
MVNRRTGIYFFLLSGLLLVSGKSIAQDNNWTHFRGSNLNAIAANEQVPLKWDDSVIRWKTSIHGRGKSSPVVYGSQVWLTTATPDGKELYAVCVDFNSGKIIHDIKIFTPEDAGGKHSLNTYASPTPCIEKGFVYVHYGSMGTACINTSDGSVVWKNTDFKCRHVQGPASSPVIYKNLLILHFEGTDVRYIVALDKATGKPVWKADRPSEPYEPLTQIGRKAYITPLIINVGGRDMMISNGSAVCIAYAPDTGREIWRVVNGAESTISMPVSEKGIVYWYSGPDLGADGQNTNYLYAVNPEGSGDITGTNVLWKKLERQSQNQMLTPVIRDGLIYTVTTRNMLMCIDASNGTEVWSTRVNSNFNASPLFISGNVWFFSVKGEVLVLKAGRNHEVVSENKLDTGIWATPAVIRNTLIIRTEDALYKIGK